MDDQDNAAAAQELPEELTITLRKPIDFGGASYTEIKLREPTAGEWEKWDKLTGVEADIMAISVVSGTPKQVVAKVGARDLLAASRFIATFLA